MVWPMVEYEADDALAAAAVKAAADPRVTQVRICTPDKDLSQCVSGTRIVQEDRLRRTTRDEAGVIAKFGVPPASIPDYLALVGDSSDGYPGLQGWGAKSAAAVLAKFGHIENIPADWRTWGVNCARPGALSITLEKDRELAMLFRDLATLRTDIPVFDSVDQLEWHGPKPAFHAIQGAPRLRSRFLSPEGTESQATEGTEIPDSDVEIAAMKQLSRREVLELAAAVAALPIGARADAARRRTRCDFFPGFQSKRVKTSGAEINLVHAGSGPPLLLMHGAPQTHVSMRLIAPELAKDYTVIVPDLRGYGDSSKPPDGENHANYSKRAMALDQVEVMKSFGFDKFAVVGHDRGGRVGHRMALDHPDKVTQARGARHHPDVLPLHARRHPLHPGVLPLVQQRARGAGAGERSEGAVRGAEGARDQRGAARIPAHVERSRRTSTRCARTIAPARRSISSTTRPTSSKKIACPLMTLWGLKGPMGRIYDVLAIWKERGVNVTGKGLGGGHNLQEDVPAEVLAELRPFLKG